MDSNEVRAKFLEFFKSKGHVIVPSSSLVPENDPSVLFTTAGMQQFKPYYLGEPSPYGNKVASIQKCIRTSDIEEVGDDVHLTFFEMLGNFSFGGYWKKEAIAYAHEFITKELSLKIDYVSIFRDYESGIPADEESREIWKAIDPNIAIREHKKEDNFWGPTGEEGPCGPTTEIYINDVEIWNIVFNEFYKTKGGKYEPLKIKGIDTGMGLERLLVQVQKKNNVYETDIFEPIIKYLKLQTGNKYNEKSARIIADHMKAVVFLIADNISPSNKERGYILRRLIRRAMVKIEKLGLPGPTVNVLRGDFQEIYKLFYPELIGRDARLTLINEVTQFDLTLKNGLKEFHKGTDPFILFTTYGLPIELTLELAKEKGLEVDLEDFNKRMTEHQKLSHTAATGMFKGGLANENKKTVRHHTAHHLLLAALQAVVSPEIKQRGSNINEERLRMDFSFDRKLTGEEKKEVEEWVNSQIKKGLNVIRREMSLAEAEKIGAQMEFGAKYPELVSVYFIEDNDGKVVSKELCGGPHVINTKELGTFKILKEGAVSQGVRRIKAILS